MKYLLDTNAWIEVLNRPRGIVATRLASNSPIEIGLSSVAYGELLVGAYKSAKPVANVILVQQFERQFATLAFDNPCADQYGRIRAYLERIGLSIGPYDLQIAANRARRQFDRRHA